MAILLATEVARLISGEDILPFVNRTVIQPLKMQHSVLGLGTFKLDEMVPVQIEHAAPEAGGGDPTAKDWDWNSPYWRKLGSPWGGVHASAPDVGRFLAEFLYARGAVVKPETAKLMIRNHNPAGLAPRGLGFDTSIPSGPKGSKTTFGHGGSTGQIAWADPTTRDHLRRADFPAGHRRVTPHPRDLAAAHIAAAVG